MAPVGCAYSILLVPFQRSIEEIHGDVFILIEPLDDKWLEPSEREKNIWRVRIVVVHYKTGDFQRTSLANSFFYLFKHFLGQKQFPKSFSMLLHADTDSSLGIN